MTADDGGLWSRQEIRVQSEQVRDQLTVWDVLEEQCTACAAPSYVAHWCPTSSADHAAGHHAGVTCHDCTGCVPA